MKIYPAPPGSLNADLTNNNFLKTLLAVLVLRLGGAEVKITQVDLDQIARKYLLAGEDHEGFYLKLVNTLEEAQNANSRPN